MRPTRLQLLPLLSELLLHKSRTRMQGRSHLEGPMVRSIHGTPRWAWSSPPGKGAAWLSSGCVDEGPVNSGGSAPIQMPTGWCRADSGVSSQRVMNCCRRYDWNTKSKRVVSAFEQL